MEDKSDDFQAKKRKGKKKNDKTEGGQRLVLFEKEAQIKGKKRPAKKMIKQVVDDKAERRRGRQKIEERNQIVKKEDEIAKSRNSVRILNEMIYALSDKQQQWVTDAGFGSLLNFELVEMPQRLAYRILEVFDERSCKLVLKSGDVEITEQAVHDVLGLPCRGSEIKFKEDERTTQRINQWRSQFELAEGQSLVKASEVVDIMKQTGDVDELFKMNFLVLMTNVLIRSNTNNSVAQTILTLYDIIDNCSKYNWAQYLLKSLVITKRRWMRTASLFYTGPMIFLLIFYVDRVCHQGKELVPRLYPAFRGWTKEKLKQREMMELAEEHAFGSGSILEVVTTEELEENEKLFWKVKYDAEKEKTATEIENYLEDWNRHDTNDGPYEVYAEKEKEDIEDVNRQDANHGPDEDWWETLNQYATLLIDANIQLIQAKSQYESQLANAKELHPNDEKIVKIEKQIKDLFKANKWMDSDSFEEDVRNTEDISQFPSQEEKAGDISQFPNQEEKAGLDLVDEAEKNELPPDHDDHLDIIAWLKSPEGILELEKDFENQPCPDNLMCPSFSLGISQICKEVMEEHGREDNKKGDEEVMEEHGREDNNKGDEYKTPLPPKEPEKRIKRDIKVGPAFRSPYIQRNIDINSSYSKQEIAVYRWMIQDGKNDMEHIFVYGQHTFIREVVRTLMPENRLSYAVIDMWSILLNARENYKSTEAPMRIFMDIGCSIAPLDEKKTSAVQYELFKSEMNHFFERYPNRKIENADLVFFPVLAYEHLYMVSFNIKKPAFHVIDNIRRGKSAAKEYGPKLKLLCRHFVTYLKEKKLELIANELKNVEVYYMLMSWQTLSNYKDCGIFFMRHMETYKGDPKNWITDLKHESIPQKAQLLKIRAKYCHAILASPLNEKRLEILKEAKTLYNKMTSDKVLSIVLAASEGKSIAVRGTKDIKGKVLFAEDDTPEDDH